MLFTLGLVIGAVVGALVASWCAAAAQADRERERMRDIVAANQPVRAMRVEANMPAVGDETVANLGGW